MIDNKTTNRNYPKPNQSNSLLDDVTRIGQAFELIDQDIQALNNAPSLPTEGIMYVNEGNIGIGTPTPQWELDVDGTVCSETILARTVRASRFLIDGQELRSAAAAQAEIDALRAVINSQADKITAMEKRIAALEEN